MDANTMLYIDGEAIGRASEMRCRCRRSHVVNICKPGEFCSKSFVRYLPLGSLSERTNFSFAKDFYLHKNALNGLNSRNCNIQNLTFYSSKFVSGSTRAHKTIFIFSFLCRSSPVGIFSIERS